jgi:alcohol dehydrogenase
MSAKPFFFQAPTSIEFGLGAAARVGKRAVGLGMRQVLLVTDKGLVESQMCAEVEGSLRESGLTVTVFSEVLPDPGAEAIAAAVRAYRAAGADSLVALGGGSPMDTAKALGVLAVAGGEDIMPFAFGGTQTPGGIPPLICLPTTAGTGSEVTCIAIVTHGGAKKLVRHPSLAPTLALVDPHLTLGMPPALTASTGLDALAHALEAMTTTMANPLSDALALDAIERIFNWLPTAVKQGDNLEARTQMSLAAMNAGLAFLNGRVHLGHAVGHSLGTVFKVPHGFACAVCLPGIMGFVAPAASEAMGKIAAVVPDSDVVKATQQLLADVQAPRLGQLTGKGHADIAELIQVVEATEGRLIDLSLRKPSPADWEQIFVDGF